MRIEELDSTGSLMGFFYYHFQYVTSLSGEHCKKKLLTSG